MTRVERRESTRLQSAAKLLRSLSKSKDKVETTATMTAATATRTTTGAVADTSSLAELDRTFPAYHSEGKGVRRRKSAKAATGPSAKGKFMQFGSEEMKNNRVK